MRFCDFRFFDRFDLDPDVCSAAFAASFAGASADIFALPWFGCVNDVVEVFHGESNFLELVDGIGVGLVPDGHAQARGECGTDVGKIAGSTLENFWRGSIR